MIGINAVSRKPPRRKLPVKLKGGAPKGNWNALKAGRFTAARRAERREVFAFLQKTRAMIAEAEAFLRAAGLWGHAVARRRKRS